MEALRVILGAAAETIHDIRLPAFVSYKFDGWRATWRGLEFFTRNGKTVQNRPLQALAKLHMMGRDGWDGELIVGEPNKNPFKRTDSFLKAHHRAIPKEGVRFYVFDNALAEGNFAQRFDTLGDVWPFVLRLDHQLIENYADLEAFEAAAIELGYEGIVARSPTGRYKAGRSTLREQYLVKLKRWKDDEGTITGLVERQHNANPAEISETGYVHRSSHKEGKVPAGTLGSFVVDWKGKELHVGTGRGLTDAERDYVWRHPDEFLGKPLTFKFLGYGTDQLPRQPIAKWTRGDL